MSLALALSLAAINGKAPASSGGVAAPANTVAPAITGTATQGQTLSASTGTWTGSPSGYGYVWNRGGTPISGATASTYVLVSGDVGVTIAVTVTATNAGGSTAATSSATGTVSATALLLDTLSAMPSEAVGLRKLAAASTKAIRVSTSGSDDGSAIDIGFVGADLDTAAMLTKAAGGTLYMVKGYDQTGNGNDWTGRLVVVSSGSLVTQNSKPAAFATLFTGQQVRGLQFAAPGTNFWVSGAYAITDPTSGNQNNPLLDGAGYGNNGFSIVANNVFDLEAIGYSNGFSGGIHGNQISLVIGSPGPAAGALFLAFARCNSANVLKGGKDSGTESATVDITGWVAGANGYTAYGSNNAASGGIYISESICGKAQALSDGDLALIRADQKAYWGTP